MGSSRNILQMGFSQPNYRFRIRRLLAFDAMYLLGEYALIYTNI